MFRANSNSLWSKEPLFDAMRHVQAFAAQDIVGEARFHPEIEALPDAFAALDLPGDVHLPEKRDVGVGR